MGDTAPELTIVIPAYNEEHRLRPTLEVVAVWLRERETTGEILVVDDGSRDATVRVAEDFAREHACVRVLRLPENRGKGAAVRAGFAESRGECVLLSDADLSTPIEEFVPLARALADGADLVIASRGLTGSNLVVRQAWYREFMGKTFNLVVRLVTGIPHRDTQCGFKLLHGSLARALAREMRENGFAFDVELILLTRARGLTVREVPVTWINKLNSRVSPVTDSLRMLLALPRILRRTGRYRD